MPKPQTTATLKVDNPTPKFGDTINVAATTDSPSATVTIEGWQDGVLVATGAVPLWGPLAKNPAPFELRSLMWVGGPASLVVRLVSNESRKPRVLTELRN